MTHNKAHSLTCLNKKVLPKKRTTDEKIIKVKKDDSPNKDLKFLLIFIGIVVLIAIILIVLLFGIGLGAIGGPLVLGGW